MLGDLLGGKRVTAGTDKAYDTHDFVEQARAMNVTPHVTQNTNGRSSAIDGRTTRHKGYRLSLTCRARIEEIYGWLKTVGGQRKTRYRGEESVVDVSIQFGSLQSGPDEETRTGSRVSSGSSVSTGRKTATASQQCAREPAQTTQSWLHLIPFFKHSTYFLRKS